MPCGALVSDVLRGGLFGVPDTSINNPENPMIPPSMYIVLKMPFPIKNALPAALSITTLPWM